MFRTSSVHHQEDHLHIFHLLDCLHKSMKTYHKILHVQMVFLMMNT